MKKIVAILFILCSLIVMNPTKSHAYWTPGWSDFWDWICTDPFDTPCPEYALPKK